MNNKQDKSKTNLDELKKRLEPLQYEVLVHSATEPPFSSHLTEHNEEGIYVDAATGQPLFSSYDKFDSGCGWPSFTKPIEKDNVRYKKDASHGMVRTEVRSSEGDFHLGHVFSDGPEHAGGLRYCINGAALRFIAKKDMEREGYADWISWLKHQDGEQI